jgi:hypothetical protein
LRLHALKQGYLANSLWPDPLGGLKLPDLVLVSPGGGRSLETKLFVLAMLSIVVAACILQLFYYQQLVVINERLIEHAPRPIRSFYDRLSLGHPWGSPFWERIGRFVAVIVGFVFLVLLILAAAFLK